MTRNISEGKDTPYSIFIRNELEWFYEDGTGACMLFPDYWEEYIKPIPKVKRYYVAYSHFFKKPQGASPMNVLLPLNTFYLRCQRQNKVYEPLHSVRPYVSPSETNQRQRYRAFIFFQKDLEFI